MGVRACGPRIAQRAPSRAGDVHWKHELRGAKAGSVDDAVHLALGAIVGHDPAFGQAGERLGDKLDVGTLERR